jgi:tetratricopeptide (TPR) repeat protein
VKTFFLSVLILLFAGRLMAADVAVDFSAANRLYAEGKFSDAAAAYEKILETGAQSTALLFNDANAEFKAGNLGRAIASYRRAAQLSPQDPEIRANLAFVRNQVQGVTRHESRWQGWLGQLSLNEWTLMAALTFWVTFLLLAAGRLRPALAVRLKNTTWAFAGLTIFFGAVLVVQAAGHFSQPTAVVLTDGAGARSGPFDEAQSAFTLRDGAELPVLDRHEGWVQVDAGVGKTGWLPVKQLALLPGA